MSETEVASGLTLSIVMPGLASRFGSTSIVSQIEEQCEGLERRVEFIGLYDNGRRSTGDKMNLLISMADGDYICAVNDDDLVEPDYVESLLEAIDEHNGVDVVTFPHSYHVNGEYVAHTIQKAGVVEAQIKGDPEVHWRLPGILCPVRAGIVKGFVYPDKSDDESDEYKAYLKNWLKTEHNIPRILYHHMWNEGNVSERMALKVKWGRK